MPAASVPVEISRGFPPIIGRAPRVLLLGSLPGRASLAAGEYYAQPHNSFWRNLGSLSGAGPHESYAARLRALKGAGIALWDMLAAAERQGSLDADIVQSSCEINDVADLLRRHRGIAVVGCNGQTAAKLFRRHVEPLLPRSGIRMLCLPSTSPAYASLTFDQKLARWRRVLAPHLRAA
jgi:hypoxanthine-DNA glycosylase